MMIDSKELIFNNEESVDLKRIVKKIKKYWKMFSMFFIGFILTGLALIEYAFNDRYLVGSSLIIKSESNPLLGTEDLLGSINLIDGSQNIENEISLLKSFSLIKKTSLALSHYITYFTEGKIKHPEIYYKSPYIVELDTNHTQLIDEKFYIQEISPSQFKISVKAKGYKVYDFKSPNLKRTLKYDQELNFSNTYSYNTTINANNFKFKVIKNKYSSEEIYPGNKFYFTINNPDLYATELQKKLITEQVNEDATLISLKLEHSIPKKAQDFLNELMRKYITRNLDEKNQIANNTLSFINSKLNVVTDSMKNAERELETFKLKHNVIDLNHETVAIYEQIKELEEKRAVEAANQKYYDYLINYVSSNDNLSNIVAPSVIGIEDLLLNNLINELRQYYTERTKLHYIAKEKNPHFEMLVANIRDTKAALIENIKNLNNNSKISSQTIDNQITNIINLTHEIPEKQRLLLGIERKFNFNNNIYVYLMEKQAEVGIAKASKVPHADVVEFARLLNFLPIYPNKKLIIILAVFLGICIPMIYIIFKELLNEKIEDKEDIEKYKIPILGSVSHNGSKMSLPIFKSPKSAISESFRTLRTNMLYLSSDKDSVVIGVTSTVSGEGKTFCSSNLAASIAFSGKKTIVLGVDLRKPQLHNIFDQKNEIGLSSYLIKNNSPEDIIIKTDNNFLDVITSGPVPPNPSELLSGKRFKELIKYLKSQYAYIILDSPPVGLVSDYYTLSQLVDNNLFIVRKNYSKVSFVADFKNQMEIKKMSNVFLVLNDDGLLMAKYGNKYSGYYEEEKKSWGFGMKRKLA